MALICGGNTLIGLLNKVNNTRHYPPATAEYFMFLIRKVLYPEMFLYLSDLSDPLINCTERKRVVDCVSDWVL